MSNLPAITVRKGLPESYRSFAQNLKFSPVLMAWLTAYAL